MRLPGARRAFSSTFDEKRIFILVVLPDVKRFSGFREVSRLRPRPRGAREAVAPGEAPVYHRGPYGERKRIRRHGRGCPGPPAPVRRPGGAERDRLLGGPWRNFRPA